MTCGDTQIEAGDLRKRLEQLQTRDESGRTGLDLQFAVSNRNEIVRLYCVEMCVFQILDQVSTNADDAKVFAARNNITKNRSTEFLPGMV